MVLFMNLNVACVVLAMAAPAETKIDPLAIGKDLQKNEYSNYTYGSGKNKIDCVQFVHEVVTRAALASGKKLTAAQSKALKVVLSADDMKKLASLVESEDDKIKGVQHALTLSGLGVAVAREDAEPGDFVQYWYKKGDNWLGHAGIVEAINADGKATIYGSHKTTLQRERNKTDKKGGVGSGPVFDLRDAKRKVFVARWTAPRKGSGQ